METDCYEMKPQIAKIDESSGEVLCDVCKGTGCLSSKLQPNTTASICWKCQGDGKLDWLSFITGKPKKKILNGSGYVGIGTSSPDSILHVSAVI